MRQLAWGLVIGGIVLFAAPKAARGGVVAEVGDAGDMPSTAQVVFGTGPLDSITGTIGGYQDADMYTFYLSDPATFSATTSDPATAAYDTQLFLFDAAGKGVVANDDTLNSGGSYNPRSTLAAGNALNPALPGIYHLAVSGWDRDPHSAGGAMFTDDTYYEGTVGAVGPGGASQITGWDGDGGLNSGIGSYTIRLTGAQFISSVPEPQSILLVIVGIIFMAAGGKRAARLAA